MTDLERQLDTYARQLDHIEPVSAAEVLTSHSHRPSGNQRAFLVAAALLVVLVLGGAVVALRSGGPDQADEPTAPVDTPTTIAPVAPLRARVELPSDTLAAGGTLSGQVVVNNDTGAPINTTSCINLYGAFLASEQYSQLEMWRTCAQPFQIPTGESRWPVTVSAIQSQCSPDGPQGTSPQCQPDGTPPPVPSGTYEVRIGSGGSGPPTPDPATITVVDR